MFDDAVKRWPTELCKSLLSCYLKLSFHCTGAFFTKYSVSAGSDGKATLMSGVAKKQFLSHDRPF